MNRKTTLKEEDRKAVDGFKEMVLREFPEAEFILFGSKARGDSHKESDIDLLIVVNSEDRRVRSQILNLSWQAMYDNGFRAFISPVIFLKREYEQYRRWNSSFLYNVDKEGVKL